MTKAELERRVAELETELAWRRSHVCPQQAYLPPVAACTCASGSRRDLTFPQPCPVHGFPSQVFTTTLRPGQNLCAGNVIVNTTGCADRPVIAMPLSNAGCAAGQTYTVTIPAG